MRFSIERDRLLTTLQQVVGVVEKRHSQPILSHFLFQVNTHQLLVIGTDLEVELQARCTLAEPAEVGEITLPGRKLIDICRALPQETILTLNYQDNKINIQAASSRFTLSTLPVESFPQTIVEPFEIEFSIPSKQLQQMFNRTYFAVAQQDVRYYLNGLLMTTSAQKLCCVGTDGHRLSLSYVSNSQMLSDYAVIIPRKAIMELLRLLDQEEESLSISITSHHIRIEAKHFTLISKRIDGRFPDYESVIPKHSNKFVSIERDPLKQALLRVSILSNEKYKGVRLQLRNDKLVLLTHNPEQEVAEEELAIEYKGEDLDIGFNVNYLLDVLNHIPEGKVSLAFADSNSSVLMTSLEEGEHSQFVVMPLRLS